MYLLSHPTGNQNMRHSALALCEAGLLAETWTCLAVADDAPWLDLLPHRARAELLRRSFPRALGGRLRLRPWREIARLATRRLGWQSPSRHEQGWCSVDAVYRDLDRQVAARLETCDGFTGVYAYEDGAAASFRVAGRLGLRRVYDLPIGYWRAFAGICREEQQREPAWAATLVGTGDSPAKLARKDRELAQADHLVVASRFTAETLARYPGRLAPVSVVPYGAPEPLRQRTWSDTGPLRVLYVGSLSQRKGLSYLFAAIAKLAGGLTLTVVGNRVAPCPALDQAMAGHTWHPSLPHHEVLRLMRAHDVLVFPSLFEGFGLVLTEAMSQGLVVITTPHTAGPDLIRDGHDGFLVPIRDPAAIAERLEWLRQDRTRLAGMGAAALASAGRRTWDAFRADLRRALG
jgi:glycosyltransferase involved in cell wall biosynthesis